MWLCLHSKTPQTQLEWVHLLDSHQRYHDNDLQTWKEIIKSSVLLLDEVRKQVKHGHTSMFLSLSGRWARLTAHSVSALVSDQQVFYYSSAADGPLQALWLISLLLFIQLKESLLNLHKSIGLRDSKSEPEEKRSEHQWWTICRQLDMMCNIQPNFSEPIGAGWSLSLTPFQEKCLQTLAAQSRWECTDTSQCILQWDRTTGRTYWEIVLLLFLLIRVLQLSVPPIASQYFSSLFSGIQRSDWTKALLCLAPDVCYVIRV